MKNIGQKYTVIALAALLTSGQVLADGKHHGQYVRESIEIADHHIFNTDIEVDGATILIRDFDNKIITATVSTGALEPDWAYSIWLAVFNYPQYCITPGECGPADLEVNGGNPSVKASVFWGGGLVADGSGSANTVFTLLKGKTKRELFAMSKDWGLQNFGGAEIHVVLRSHGVAGIAGPVSQQIGTATEACPETGCKNEFASIHRRQY